MEDPQIAAVILAAGRSSRMGRQKLSLPWNDDSVLGHVISVFAHELGTEAVVVVTGASRTAVEDIAKRKGVRTVFNADHEIGEMLSSIKAGLRALGPEVSAALIGLGDQPLVEATTILAILAAHESTGARLVVPSFDGRRGHPWLVHRTFWAPLLHLEPWKSPRDFLRARADEIHHLSVQTASVLSDLDTPDDYARARDDR